MRRAFRAMIWAWLTATSTVRAADDDDESRRASSPTGLDDPTGVVGFSLRSRAGDGTTPFDAPPLPRTSAHGATGIAAAWIGITTNLWASVRMPFVIASVQQPAGSYVDATTLGNLEVSMMLRRVVWRSPRGLELRLAVRAGAGAPLAEHEPSLLANRALAFGNAMNGFGDPELYAAGLVPLTAAPSIELAASRWSVRASVKGPLFLRVSDANLGEAGTVTRSIGTSPLAEASAGAWLVRDFGARIGARAAFLRLAPPASPPSGTPWAIVMIEPALLFRLGTRAALSLEGSISLGYGDVGRSTGAGLALVAAF